MYYLSAVLIILSCIVINNAQFRNRKMCKNGLKSSITTVTKNVPGNFSKRHFCSGDLIFEDNFDKFNFKVWRHENTLSGGGNWEFQWYTNNRTNSFVKNGILYIKPSLTEEILGVDKILTEEVNIEGFYSGDYCTDTRFFGCKRTGFVNEHGHKIIINPIRSAKITTTDSFSFKYGRLQVRAKMPTGDWLWPAFWLFPKYNAYGFWPTSGTINIAESRGNTNLDLDNDNIGVKQVTSTLHWGADVTHNNNEKTTFVTSRPEGFNNYFSIYEMIWTPDNITFIVDGIEQYVVDPGTSFWNFANLEGKGQDNPWISGDKMAPFDDEFFLIINLAVGGISTYFPDTAHNLPLHRAKPWNNQSPQAAFDFWNGRDSWLPTWQLDDKINYPSAFQIDYIRIWAL